MVVAVLFGFLSFLFAVLGLMVWKFKWVGIIAGYEESKVKDKNGLAGWFGKCLLGLSLCLLLLSILAYYLSPFSTNAGMLFGISSYLLVQTGTVITLAGITRYYNF
jgi:hypothetical protein